MQRIIHVAKQWDVILTAFKPALRRFFWILFGVILGMLLVYLFVPVKFENNAEPVQLGENYKDQWLKGLAAEYESWTRVVETGGATTFNPVQEAQAKLVDAGITTEDIDSLRDENANNAVLVNQLNALRPLAEDAESRAIEKRDQYPNPGFWNNVIVPLLSFLGMVVVILIPTLFFAVYTFYDIPVIGPIAKRMRQGAPSEADLKMKAEREARAVAKEMAATQKTAFDTPPVTQFMSTYLLGDNYYDDSFAIELADNTFLGECGSGIAETIGVGDPKKVSATEVWIFDKNDISTVTHVLMSEHAYNDESIRAKLAARGEPVLATPGGTTILDTQTLRAQIRIVDMQYGDGALPPHSFFERMTVEIAVWQKEGAEEVEPPVRTPMGSGTQPIAPMPQTPPPQYAPPPVPQQPAPQYAPPPQPQFPQQPPPQGMPPQGPPPQQPYPQQPPPQQRPPQPMPPQGMPPQGPPPQQPYPQQPPPQRQGPPPGPPPQQGGGQYAPPPRAPMPPQQPPGQQPPPSPFGDTGEVNY
jgi:hypothetical protein